MWRKAKELLPPNDEVIIAKSFKGIYLEGRWHKSGIGPPGWGFLMDLEPMPDGEFRAIYTNLDEWMPIKEFGGGMKKKKTKSREESLEAIIDRVFESTTTYKFHLSLREFGKGEGSKYSAILETRFEHPNPDKSFIITRPIRVGRAGKEYWSDKQNHSKEWKSFIKSYKFNKKEIDRLGKGLTIKLRREWLLSNFIE